jgi:hypothetical protein
VKLEADESSRSARAALCQCESFMLQADESTAHDVKMRELASTLHSSVASISETIREFIQLDVAKYLPVSAIAYLALPIILNSLDLKNLSPTNARTEAKKRQLRILNEAMDLCSERYGGAHLTNGSIRKTLEAARSEQEEAAETEIPMSSSVIPASPDAIPDWFEVFVNKPQQYLRISFSIDLSLAAGKYPDKKDLPRLLSLHNRLIQSNSVPKSLMPEVPFKSTPSETALLLNPRLLEPASNSFLDFMDFGDGQSAGEKEPNPWTGQTVDKILEEVLGGGGRFWE